MGHSEEPDGVITQEIWCPNSEGKKTPSLTKDQKAEESTQYLKYTIKIYYKKFENVS